MDLSSSYKAALFLKLKMSQAESEEFWVIALNSQCVLIDARMLFKGTVDECLFHPRDIFRFAVIQNASKLIVGHNHPSGCCKPSHEDIKLTRQLFKIGKLFKIPVLDHIIISTKENTYYSFSAYLSCKF
jgi:DNA repair protein RadC